jgi:hypothetical protein
MFQPLTGPKSPMFETPAADRIKPTKKRPANTSVPGMNNLNLSWIDRSLTRRASHQNSPSSRPQRPHLEEAAPSIRKGSIFDTKQLTVKAYTIDPQCQWPVPVAF